MCVILVNIKAIKKSLSVTDWSFRHLYLSRKELLRPSTKMEHIRRDSRHSWPEWESDSSDWCLKETPKRKKKRTDGNEEEEKEKKALSRFRICAQEDEKSWDKFVKNWELHWRKLHFSHFSPIIYSIFVHRWRGYDFHLVGHGRPFNNVRFQLIATCLYPRSEDKI